MADSTFYLFDTESYQQVDTAHGHAGDVTFPAHIGNWTEVLDCRHTPYTEQSIEENCNIARHVRKKYILINQDQLPAGHAEA